MVTFITVVYVVVCLFLILVVLLQAGRGGGMGAAMGGSSQAVFGGAGAGNFLQRLTVVSASLFMILSAVLAYLSSTGEQALDRAEERMRMREEARTVEVDENAPVAAAVAAVDAGLSITTPVEPASPEADTPASDPAPDTDDSEAVMPADPESQEAAEEAAE